MSGITGEVRAPAIDSLEPTPAQGGLTAGEVDQIIAAAVNDARRSVAGIRLPRGSHVTVHVAVVDVRGVATTYFATVAAVLAFIV